MGLAVVAGPETQLAVGQIREAGGGEQARALDAQLRGRGKVATGGNAALRKGDAVQNLRHLGRWLRRHQFRLRQPLQRERGVIEIRE